MQKVIKTTSYMAVLTPKAILFYFNYDWLSSQEYCTQTLEYSFIHSSGVYDEILTKLVRFNSQKTCYLLAQFYIVEFRALKLK